MVRELLLAAECAEARSATCQSSTPVGWSASDRTHHRISRAARVPGAAPVLGSRSAAVNNVHTKPYHRALASPLAAKSPQEPSCTAHISVERSRSQLLSAAPSMASTRWLWREGCLRVPATSQRMQRTVQHEPRRCAELESIAAFRHAALGPAALAVAAHATRPRRPSSRASSSAAL